MAGAKDQSRFAVKFAEMVRDPHGSDVQIQRQSAGPGRSRSLRPSFRRLRRFLRHGFPGVAGFFFSLPEHLKPFELLGGLLAQLSSWLLWGANALIPRLLRQGALAASGHIQFGKLLKVAIQIGAAVDCVRLSPRLFLEVEGRPALGSLGGGLQLL